MTSLTVHHAKDPHPSVHWALDVKSAAMTEGALYLQLGDLDGTFVKIERTDLVLEDTQTLSFKSRSKR